MTATLASAKSKALRIAYLMKIEGKRCSSGRGAMASPQASAGTQEPPGRLRLADAELHGRQHLAFVQRSQS